MFKQERYKRCANDVQGLDLSRSPADTDSRQCGGSTAQRPVFVPSSLACLHRCAAAGCNCCSASLGAPLDGLLH